MRSLAKHSSTLSKAIINSGALESLAVCVEEFDPGVKESAAWALAYIAKFFPSYAGITSHWLAAWLTLAASRASYFPCRNQTQT